MNPSGYVCAAFESLGEIIDKFLTEEGFGDCFSREMLNSFFLERCNKFLHSFGQSFSGRKKYDSYAKKEADLFRKLRGFEFFNDCIFITDSGGFQASIGLLDKRETDILSNIYYDDFLVNHADAYDRAFVLDIPPGPGCNIFSTFQDVYDMNHASYMRAANLPDIVREKMVYIHHFRTPRLWDIYTRIMDENDLFDKFKYHATGGIVANMASDVSIPCIIYVLPLIPLIVRAKKYNRQKLYFHILGGANYRDIFFYELFKLHVQKVHNLELEITYDSSGIFKGLMIGRWLPVLLDGSIHRLNLRTSNLDLRRKNKIDELKIVEIYRDEIKKLCRFGFKDINMDKVYDEATGTFLFDVRSYSMLHMLDVYKQAEDYLKVEAADIYKYFEEGEIDEMNHELQKAQEAFKIFNRRVSLITRQMNEEKTTKKQISKSNSVVKSLEMLTDLDEEYCKYIVNKFLEKDEFISLGSDKYLTF